MQETKVKIVGLGGAGCRIVDRLSGTTSRPAALVAVHTDVATLDPCLAPTKVQIGETLTRGFGTGGDADTGRRAALEDKEMLRALFNQVRLVLLVGGLGGGTASGAAPALMEAAKEEGAMVMAFVTLPFAFEGPRRMVRARQALETLRPLADALVILPNERLAAMADQARVAQTFRSINTVLAEAMHGVERLLCEPGLIQLDFADLQRLFNRHGGACTLAYGEGQGDGKARQALDALLGSPLLEGGRILAGAHAVLLGIAGGEDMTLKEVGDIAQEISSRVGADGTVRIGTAIQEDARRKIALTALVSDSGQTRGSARTGSDDPAARMADGASAVARRPQALQTRLKLEVTGKGRFKDVEPTVHEGQDLDVPTFMRRGIVIAKG